MQGVKLNFLGEVWALKCCACTLEDPVIRSTALHQLMHSSAAEGWPAGAYPLPNDDRSAVCVLFYFKSGLILKTHFAGAEPKRLPDDLSFRAH